MSVKYTKREIEKVLSIVKSMGPARFSELAKHFAKDVLRPDEIDASIRAWGMDPNEGSGNRFSRSREN